MSTNNNLEIEAHFLEVDVPTLQKKLLEIGAEDLGEDFLREIIIYDKEVTWRPFKFLRIRETKKGIYLTYKYFKYKNNSDSPNEKPVVTEIEIKVDSFDKTKELLKNIDLNLFREQEKRRHSYKLGEVIFDIDFWPSIPPYIEIEGPSEELIKKAATGLGFEWKKAIFRGAAYIIEHFYHIPVTQLKSFTFSKIE